MTKLSWICCTHTTWSCAFTRPHLAVIWIASSSSVSPAIEKSSNQRKFVPSLMPFDAEAPLRSYLDLVPSSSVSPVTEHTPHTIEALCLLSLKGPSSSRPNFKAPLGYNLNRLLQQRLA